MFLGAGAGQTTTELACLATPANSELFGFVAFGGFFNLLRWELLTSGADLGATGFAALTPVSLAPSLFFSSADLAASLANPMAFLDLTLVAAAFQRAAAWESAALLHAQEVTS